MFLCIVYFNLNINILFERLSYKEIKNFCNVFKKKVNSGIMYKEDINMEMNEILNIYNNYKEKISDLWRSL